MLAEENILCHETLTIIIYHITLLYMTWKYLNYQAHFDSAIKQNHQSLLCT